MSLRYLISTILLLTFLTACGSGGGSSSRLKTFDTDSPNAVEAGRNWQVRCLNPSECPDTVAQMLMVAGGRGGVCTATLIADDMALTNSHCFDLLPNKSPEQICTGGRTILIFASNSPRGREVVECDSIIRKSTLQKEDGFRSPDYMIIKLKRPLNRGYEKVSTEGLKDGDRLVIKKVNPVTRNLGELEVSTCEVLHGTALLPANRNKHSPVHVTKGCRVIQGNSGSSMFDSQGRVRGVIFATLDADRLDENETEIPGELIQTMRKVRPGFMTNAACMQLPNTSQLPEACLRGRMEHEQNLPTINLPGFEILRQQINLLSLDSRFEYSFVEGKSKGLKAKISYRPYCRKKDSTFAQLESVRLVNWQARVAIDLRLQATLKPGDAEPEICLFRMTQGQTNDSVLAKPTTLSCSLFLKQESGWNEPESWPECATKTLPH